MTGTTRRLFTDADRQEILDLLAAGNSVRDVEKITGWSIGKISGVKNSAYAATAMVNTPLPFTSNQRDKLGADVVDWAQSNRVAVRDMKGLMKATGGWFQPSNDTATLLALARQVHAELVKQTGGVAPTMRAALYRMMGVYGAGKKLYRSLVTATTIARKWGVLPRDFWAEAGPLSNWHPGWWTAEEALRSDLRPLARPPLTLRETGLVVGVAVEAAGQALGLEGAIENRLGYELPVWPTGGMGSLPRIDYVAAQMADWAEQNDADEAVLLVITDFDPSGVVIGAQITEQVFATAPDVQIVRLGMDPDVAAAHNAVSAGATGESFSDGDNHAKSAVWLDACAEHFADPEDKDECFQAEALDYETWASIIGDEVEDRLIGRPVNTSGHNPDFMNGDRILAAIERRLDNSVDLEELADWLEDGEES